jgi:hypothetical protein
MTYAATLDRRAVAREWAPAELLSGFDRLMAEIELYLAFVAIARGDA